MKYPFFDKGKKFSTNQIFADILESYIIYCSVLTLSALFHVFMLQTMDNSSWIMYTAIFPLLFAFLRRCNFSLPYMLGFHLALCIPYPLIIFLYTPIDSSTKITISICISVIAVFSLRQRFKTTKELRRSNDTIILAIVVHIPAILLAMFYGVDVYAKLVLLDFAFAFLFYMCMRQLDTFSFRYAHYINKNSVSSHAISRKTVFSVIGALIFGGIFIPTIFLLPFDRIRTAVCKVVSSVIVYLVNLIPQDGASGASDQFQPDENITGKPISEIGDNLPNLQTLSSVIEFICTIAIIAFAFYVIFYVIRRIVRYILANYRTEESHDEANLYVIDTDEEIERSTSRRKTTRIAGDPETRAIRDKYRRTVNRALKSGAEITPSNSPNEIREATDAFTSINMKELTSKYNLARYGNKDE